MDYLDEEIKISKFSNFVKSDENFYLADLNLGGGETTSRHYHDFYEFFVVISGGFLEVCNNENTVLVKKQMHVLRPGDVHQLHETGKCKKNILRNIAVRKTYFEKCIKEVGVSNCEAIFDCFVLDDAMYMQFINKTNTLLQNSGNKVTGEFVFNSILTDVIIFGILQGEGNKSAPSWLTSAYRDIKLNRNYVLGIDKFFELTGKTQEHVTRTFKKYYNITPTEYINKLRLADAANQLMADDETVTNIALECGFNNISHFNKLFKEHYNLSPKDFRNRNCKFF